MSERINLGDRVKDVYTGFEGIAVCRTLWLHGCDRIGIEPTKLDKDGKSLPIESFDEPRLKLVKRMKVKDLSEPKPQRKTGGPRPEPERAPDPKR